VVDVPEEFRADAEHYREKDGGVDCRAARHLLEKYLAGETLEQPSTDESRSARGDHRPDDHAGPLRLGIQRTEGSSSARCGGRTIFRRRWTFLQVKGINPDDESFIERKASDEEPFSALIFKIMTDPYVGQLAFFRVYSGHVESGAQRWPIPDEGEQRAASVASSRCMQISARR